jgi:oligoribonuclease
VNSIVRNAQNLIWIDLEMTGLDPSKERIIEIATVVTDAQLNVLGQGPVLAIHQSPTLIAAMDDWNQTHHGQSGLVRRVEQSTITEEQAEIETIAFLEALVPAGISPMCGNTVGQDRLFLKKYMPKLEAYFSYRSIDVSTIKELCARWQPDIHFAKKNAHLALDDILESIGELRFYRDICFKI